ncbi:hypothetical protein DW352_14455 [Pseudolabrys taiwanensis]|uniref:Uncharacterized protein n=1 Tax=Pseudolabrys taiwanensis TaxID=331696 RepID=A0A345ZXG7_9HYPH|nr:hypothetical protein [Pseudolabrys taiwanensis]AXK81614.1 hypothetical protein DW352_14455 [Pseudolabrys taiwanensis]
MEEQDNPSSVEVNFPAGAQYGNALYHLRKALKQEFDVEVHKRPDGALIMCPKEMLSAVVLKLGTLDGYTIGRVQES